MRRRLVVLLAAFTLISSAVVSGAMTPAAAQTGTAQAHFLTGTGDRTNPHVVVRGASGTELGGFMAFNGPTGARVAAGDITGDPQPEIVVGTGPGVASQVAVFSLSGALLGSFSPYGGFPGGVYVGVGDVDGDSVGEIVTGAGAGGGPHVIVWDWNNGATAKHGWYAYGPSFKGGVRVAVADVVGSSRADVVTGPGAGGGPHVRVWDTASQGVSEAAGWMAYGANFTGGVSVGAGTIDGAPAVVTGPGPGGGPHVRVFSNAGAVRGEFFAYAPNYHGGVNVMIAAPSGASMGHVVTAPASWGGAHLRGFTVNGAELFGLMAYGGATINGVHLGPIPSGGSTNNTNQNGSSSSS